MGVAERDYIRNRPQQRGGYGGGSGGNPLTAMSMWSVNTWIIAICVAVFVIDSFLPMRDVVTNKYYYNESIDVIPDTSIIDDPTVEKQRLVQLSNGKTIAEKYYVKPVLAQPGGPQIGWVDVYRMHFLESALHFSTRLGFLKVQFWRLIGFQFLHSHANIMHLLFNMMGLYFFGSMIERYLGSKRYLAFYLLCGIFGALMYCLLNIGGVIAATYMGSDGNIPGLLFNDPNVPLVGASAGVFGVLMAGAYLAPNVTVLLFFILPMRLKTLAYALVAIALFTVITGGGNAGGEAGHLGGAFAGFYFIRHTQHLHGFFDFLGRIDPTSHHYRDKARGLRPGGAKKGRKEIDRILDKISSKGLHSLTEKEKKILSEASHEK